MAGDSEGGDGGKELSERGRERRSLVQVCSGEEERGRVVGHGDEGGSVEALFSISLPRGHSQDHSAAPLLTHRTHTRVSTKLCMDTSCSTMTSCLSFICFVMDTHLLSSLLFFSHLQAAHMLGFSGSICLSMYNKEFGADQLLCKGVLKFEMTFGT